MIISFQVWFRWLVMTLLIVSSTQGYIYVYCAFSCIEIVHLCYACRIVSVQTFVLSALLSSHLMWSALTMPPGRLLPETSSPPTRSVFLWVSYSGSLSLFASLTIVWCGGGHASCNTESIIKCTRLNVILPYSGKFSLIWRMGWRSPN